MADTLFTPSDIVSDLQLLERTLQRLVVDYELFFTARAESKGFILPPQRRLAEVEAIVKHFIKHPPHRTADRFRFNTLVHRYRTSAERWRRRMKTVEEQGAQRAGAAERRAVEDLTRPQILATTRLREGSATGGQVRDMYLAYRTARRARGLPVADLAYTPFADKIAERLGQARERAPGRDLEMRVDEVGGKIRITVRPAPASDRGISAADASPRRTGGAKSEE